VADYPEPLAATATPPQPSGIGGGFAAIAGISDQVNRSIHGLQYDMINNYLSARVNQSPGISVAARHREHPLLPQTVRVTVIRVIWYGHSRCKGGYPSLLARRYRPHGHNDEFSHVEHRSRDGRRHPEYRYRGTRDVYG